MKQITLVIVLFVGIVSCKDFVDLDDFENIKSVKAEGDYAIPLVKFNFKASDIDFDDLATIDNSNDSLKFIYKSSFVPTRLDKMVQLENNDLKYVRGVLSGGVLQQLNNSGSLTIQGSDFFTLSNQYTFEKILFKNGIISVRIIEDLQHPFTFTLKIPNLSKDGVLFETTISADSAIGDNKFVKINLNDYVFSNSATNKLDFEYELYIKNSGSVLIDAYEIELTANNLDYREISFIPNRDLRLTQNNVSIFSDDLLKNLLKNKQYISPSLKVLLKNNYLTELNAELINPLVYINPNTTPNPISGIPKDFVINSSSDYVPFYKEILFNENQTDLKSQLVENMQDIRYSSSVVAKAGNILTGKDTSSVSLDMQLEIPVAGYVNDYLVESDYDVSGIDSLDIKYIKTASLRFNYESKLPFSAVVNLLMLNENNDSIGVLLEDLLLLESPEISNDGYSENAIIKQFDIELTQEQLLRLGEAKDLRLKMILNTGKPSNPRAVAIRASDYLDLKVGLRAETLIEEEL